MSLLRAAAVGLFALAYVGCSNDHDTDCALAGECAASAFHVTSTEPLTSVTASGAACVGEIYCNTPDAGAGGCFDEVVQLTGAGVCTVSAVFADSPTMVVGPTPTRSVVVTGSTSCCPTTYEASSITLGAIPGDAGTAFDAGAD